MTATFTKYAKAAEDCRYKNDFQYDLRQCDKALHMGGPMQIEAQCWMNLLDQLEEGDIKAHDYFTY